MANPAQLRLDLLGPPRTIAIGIDAAISFKLVKAIHDPPFNQVFTIHETLLLLSIDRGAKCTKARIRVRALEGGQESLQRLESNLSPLLTGAHQCPFALCLPSSTIALAKLAHDPTDRLNRVGHVLGGTFGLGENAGVGERVPKLLDFLKLVVQLGLAPFQHI